MNKLETLKSKYDKIVKDSLRDNHDIIIESFVEYYGEKYREVIERRYDEIVFAYYVDYKWLDQIVSDFIPSTKEPEKYEDFVLLRDAKQEQESRKKTILFKLKNALFKRHSGMPVNLVGTTARNNDEKQQTICVISEYLTSHTPREINYSIGGKMKRVVLFPIMLLGNKDIIHEINHAITSSLLAILTDEENQTKPGIYKIGVEVSDKDTLSPDKKLEELINEEASLEITRTFKRFGGDFSSFCYNLPFINLYSNNLYLINDFYYAFKDKLKESRITDNKNALVQKVGKDNYQALLDFIDANYNDTIEEGTPPDKSVTDKLTEIVNNMRKNAVTEKEPSKEQIQSYYQELANQGYTVTPMEDLAAPRRR